VGCRAAAELQVILDGHLLLHNKAVGWGCSTLDVVAVLRLAFTLDSGLQDRYHQVMVVSDMVWQGRLHS
jgi:hypothetical protein